MAWRQALMVKDTPMPDGQPPACALRNTANSCLKLLAGLLLMLAVLALFSTELLELMIRMMRVDIFAFGGRNLLALDHPPCLGSAPLRPAYGVASLSKGGARQPRHARRAHGGDGGHPGHGR